MLSDNFNDDFMDTALWTKASIFNSAATDAAVTVLETSNQLRITPITSAGVHSNGYRSATTMNLTGTYALVEVVQATSLGSAADTMLVVALDNSNSYRITKEDDQLYFESLAATVYTETHLAYVNATHRWWRIRHVVSGNLIEFHTSTDGVNWGSAHRSIGLGFAITAVRVGVEAGTYNSQASPGFAIFDNFEAGWPTVTVGESVGVTDLKQIPA